MWNLFKSFYHAICEELGQPMHLSWLMGENPNMRVQLTEPKQVVDAHKVVQWHDWGVHGVCSPNYPAHHKQGTILGWRQSSGEYRGFEYRRQELENFGRCEVQDQWSCDIQDVTGLSASKSNLHEFTSLDSLVEKNAREMIDEITEDKLYKNIAHSEIRILNKESKDDYFVRYRWDGRVFLMNTGGSHHFAAARYIASVDVFHINAIWQRV